MKAQSIRIFVLIALTMFVGGIGFAGAASRSNASGSNTSRSAKADTPRSKSSARAAAAKSSARTSTSSRLVSKSFSGSAKKLATRKPATPRGQMAPTSERVSEIQAALAGQGAYQGDPSGRWDDSTVDAMRKYQSSQGLNPSGKLDAVTLEKLGLGSVTAGRAAPMPTANPSPNLLISRSQVPQQTPQEQK